ncbi:hypothetical protein O0L34_g15563 [Tuta absoluta]|nr:hypothetical protein O0L34_g15563 [Tuta absoluta]
MVAKVAVVTGSNKGIGFAIVKELCRRGVEIVYLTSRDEAKGREAVEKLHSVKSEDLKEEDWCGMNVLPYRTSKIAVCALTRVQQNEVGKNISVNCIHPGLVQTDMTKNTGMLTMDQAAKAPVYLALDIDQSVKGKYFWFDKQERDWANHDEKLHFNRDEILDFLKENQFYDKWH